MTDQAKEIRYLLLLGASPKSIRKMLDIRHSSLISYQARKLGMPLFTRGRSKGGFSERTMAILSDSGSQVAVARRHGVSRQWVQQIRRRQMERSRA